MVVYVLLFNARTENEGIHILRTETNEEVVLMFEHEDDATRYALMLEAQDFLEATVEGFEQEEIEEYCESVGCICKLVPEGALAVPPERNVERTEWDPNQPPDQLPQRPETTREPEAEELSQAELDRIRQQFEKLL